MKKIMLTMFVTLLIVGCGNNSSSSVEEVIATNNLEKIRTYKTSLNQKYQILSSQIKQLEEKIAELDPEEKIPLVSVLAVKESVFEHFLELQGSVNTDQNIVITPEFSGILTKIYVKEGQTVRKGQLLAKIDDGGLDQQLAQLNIQAALAKTTFERQQRLWEQKIGSEIQYLQAKSSYEAQAEAVDQLKAQIAKTTIRAPFSGTIDDVITEQGNVVGAGQSALFRLVNLNDMYVEAKVPESHITNVTKGKAVTVIFPILAKKVKTKIRQAGNYINPANRTFKIEVPIPNKARDIKPNLTAKLEINDYTNPQAILIPQSIISENAKGQQYVYIIRSQKENKGIAKKVIIKTGKTQGDKIEVLEGLKNHDQLIQEGARSVKDNQEVKILNLND